MSCILESCPGFLSNNHVLKADMAYFCKFYCLYLKRVTILTINMNMNNFAHILHLWETFKKLSFLRKRGKWQVPFRHKIKVDSKRFYWNNCVHKWLIRGEISFSWISEVSFKTFWSHFGQKNHFEIFPFCHRSYMVMLKLPNKCSGYMVL